MWPFGKKRKKELTHLAWDGSGCGCSHCLAAHMKLFAGVQWNPLQSTIILEQRRVITDRTLEIIRQKQRRRLEHSMTYKDAKRFRLAGDKLLSEYRPGDVVEFLVEAEGVSLSLGVPLTPTIDWVELKNLTSALDAAVYHARVGHDSIGRVRELHQKLEWLLTGGEIVPTKIKQPLDNLYHLLRIPHPYYTRGECLSILRQLYKHFGLQLPNKA